VNKFGLLTGALLLLLTTSAVAQEAQYGATGRRRQPKESGQEALLELRFGRYIPKVDEQVDGSPFETTFGNDNRYMFGIEVDWQLIRIPMFGTISPGVAWGYTRASANAPLLVPDPDNPKARSKEVTTLNIMPFYLMGVVRADVFTREFGIPLVPYAKLGLGHAIWWSRVGDRISRDPETGKTQARGASSGWQYALGLMLHLDPIDPQSAAIADASIGLNNSYAFLEWYVSDLDGFGASDKMQVGTNTWAVGLATEF
jgi:hypothetical protein